MQGDDFGLGDIVSQLKHFTGHTDAKQVIAQGATIDRGEVLRLQQSLKWHPIFLRDYPTTEKRMHLLVEMITEAREADVDPLWGDGLASINKVADELEYERTRFVNLPAFHAQFFHDGLLTRLGIDALPELDRVSESRFSPWNVLWNLVLSDSQGLCPPSTTVALEVPNATVPILVEIQKIKTTCYDTVAWQKLLTAIGEFPLASVRSVWGAALCLFPTSSRLVELYVSKELAAMSENTTDWESGDAAKVHLLFRNCSRLLNTFYRHLHYCYSDKLYAMFFDFIRVFIQPEPKITGFLYTECLRIFGHMPHSTQLWLSFIDWRSQTRVASVEQKKWEKRRLQHLLRIPLFDLQSVNERLDALIQTEFRGVIDREEKQITDSHFLRARKEGESMQSCITYLFHQKVSLDGRAAAEFFYLPRPLLYQPDPNSNSSTSGASAAAAGEGGRGGGGGGKGGSSSAINYFNAESVQNDIVNDVEMRTWLSWQNLLNIATSSSSSDAFTKQQQHQRLSCFARAAACYFPHHCNLWYKLVERSTADREVPEAKLSDEIDVVQHFLPHHPFVATFVAEAYYTHLHRPWFAYSTIRSALLYQRAFLLHMIRERDDTGDLDASGGALSRACAESLKQICTLSVIWMRFSSESMERYHLALVARHVLHDIGFLSLTMGVLRWSLKRDAGQQPTEFFRPFGTFCANWIHLEIVRDGRGDIALGILQKWGDYILLTLKSAASRNWTAESCGADELFVSCCYETLIAHFPSKGPLLTLVRSIKDYIEEQGIESPVFVPAACRFLHALFAASAYPESQSVLTAKNVCHLNYDSRLFSSPAAARSMWCSLLTDTRGRAATGAKTRDVRQPSETTNTSITAARVAGEEEEKGNEEERPPTQTPNSTFTTADLSFPDESLWGVFDGAGSGRMTTIAPTAHHAQRPFVRDEKGFAFPSSSAVNAASTTTSTTTITNARKASVQRRRFVTCQSDIFGLGDCLHRSDGGFKDTTSATSAKRPHRLKKLESLIKQLPSFTQFYSVHSEELGHVSPEWLIDSLAQMTSLDDSA